MFNYLKPQLYYQNRITVLNFYFNIRHTPFYLLITKVNKLNIYQWNSSYMDLIVDFSQETCLNALLFQENSIIVDCYNLTYLNMYVNQENFGLLLTPQQFNKYQKKRTQSFTSNQIYSILYAQYYDDDQILTQFQFDHYLLFNISNWKLSFINFIVSNRLQSQNTIYLWDDQTLHLVNQLNKGRTQQIVIILNQIVAVQLFNPQRVFQEYNTLLVGRITIYYSIICNQTVQETKQISSLWDNLNPLFQSFLSNQFLIVQLFDLIQIYENINLKFKLIGAITFKSQSTQVQLQQI
ncbi:unnamed protein product [Paramecium octaurelia]|uniref:Uncharacterized protein n=1 Tax=Paramecium octaurelia TaxID=43137 RepID=A0A8S1XCB7_PAROT|nr:unnamed protein product [Paramecium octaurelia]